MEDVEQTIISQYGATTAIAGLCADMNEWLDQSTNWEQFYDNFWNIATAVGQGLDYWGDILGVSRLLTVPNTALSFGFQDDVEPPDTEPFNQGPFNIVGSSGSQTYLLPDSAYQVLLLAKALANISATSAPALNQLLLNLFPGRGPVFVRDLGAMAMQVLFLFDLTAVEYAILTTSGVFPHPAGVSVSVIVVNDNLFGFVEAAPYAQPFGSGTFYQVD